MSNVFIVSCDCINKEKIIKAISDSLEMVMFFNEKRLSRHVYGNTMKIKEIETIMPVGIIQDCINELLATTELTTDAVVTEIVERCTAHEFEVYTGEDGHGEIILLQWQSSDGAINRKAFIDNEASLYERSKSIIEDRGYIKVK